MASRSHPHTHTNIRLGKREMREREREILHRERWSIGCVGKSENALGAFLSLSSRAYILFHINLYSELGCRVIYSRSLWAAPDLSVLWMMTRNESRAGSWLAIKHRHLYIYQTLTGRVRNTRLTGFFTTTWKLVLFYLILIYEFLIFFVFSCLLLREFALQYFAGRFLLGFIRTQGSMENVVRHNRICLDA